MRMPALLLLAALLVAGCSGGGRKAPEPVFYLLRAGASLPAGEEDPPVQIGINRVSVADYLAQDGIVVATGGDQVKPARQHLWAEPLDDSIRLYLRDTISAELGYAVSADTGRRAVWQYRVDVRIDEWHSSLGGNTRIVASWSVIDVANNSELARYRFVDTGALSSDGYDALVAAQSRLLTAFGNAIAASLQGLGG